MEKLYGAKVITKLVNQWERERSEAELSEKFLRENLVIICLSEDLIGSCRVLIVAFGLKKLEDAIRWCALVAIPISVISAESIQTKYFRSHLECWTLEILMNIGI